MNKLWVFGDSYSEPFSKIGAMKWKMDYNNWKGYTPKCYGEMVSDKLKLKHINLAIGGADNYTILDSIISVLNAINSNDIIIIGWSHTIRFRVVNTSGTFSTIRPRSLSYELESKKITGHLEISNSTITELAVNRDNSIYIDELNNYIKLLNFSFSKNKIIHWSPFRLDSYGLLTTQPSLKQLEIVSKETNGKIDDAHFSENGHIKLSEQFIDTIDKYEWPVIKKTFL